MNKQNHPQSEQIPGGKMKQTAPARRDMSANVSGQKKVFNDAMPKGLKKNKAC